MMVGNRRYGAMRRKWWGIVAVLVALTVVVVPTRGALAEEVEPVLASISFDLDGFQDMLLVEATDRLFITGGTTDDTLLVIDLDGNEIARVTGLSGVRQLASDPVSGWVWVAESGGPSVRAYDSTTGAFEKKLDLPPAMCPSAIALAGVSEQTPVAGNESLVVGSECDDTLVVVDLADFSNVPYSGFDNVIQLSEQAGRFVLLDDEGVKRYSFDDLTTPNSEYLVSATAMDNSSQGARSVAIATASDVRILTYPDLSLAYTFSGLPPTIAIAWTNQPAVVGVNVDNVIGLKPAVAGPYWSFPVGDAVPYPNGIQAHSDGRIYIAAELPSDPGGGGGGGGGGTGVIVPGEEENPASLSGTVTAALPATAGHTPDTLEASLLDANQNAVAVDSVSWASGEYSFTTVQPGTYYLEFRALTGGAVEGFFAERYSDLPLLSKTSPTAVVLSSGKDTVVDATLRPLFADMYGLVFYNDILWMGNTSITKGCNPPNNTLYCGADFVTRGQMAAFLVRALGLTDSGTVDFVDDDDSIFELDIEKLATAGITKGCNPPANTKFCPDASVTRGQMAAFLVRALGLTDSGNTDFVDDNGSIFEADIEKLATAGITKGCNPPTNDKFCPDAFVTRGQLAAFLNRAVSDLWPSE
jgi:hypothetical protein